MTTDAGQQGTAPLPQTGGAGVPQTLVFDDGRFLTISEGNTIDLSGLAPNPNINIPLLAQELHDSGLDVEDDDLSDVFGNDIPE